MFICFSDDFNRPDSPVVGNDWVEYTEQTGYVVIDGNRFKYGWLGTGPHGDEGVDVGIHHSLMVDGNVVIQVEALTHRADNTTRLFAWGDSLLLEMGFKGSGGNDGEFYYRQGGVVTNFGNYVIDQWYTWKLTLDFVAQTYDIDIDNGAFTQLNIPFDNVADTIDRVGLYAYAEEPGASYGYFDDFIVQADRCISAAYTYFILA